MQAILGQLQPRDHTSVATVEPAGAPPRGNSESPPAKAEQGTPSVVREPAQQPSPTPARQQGGGSFGEKGSVAMGAPRDKGSTLAGASPPPGSCHFPSFLGIKVASNPTVWWRPQLPVNLVPVLPSSRSHRLASLPSHMAGNWERPCLRMTAGLLQCWRHSCSTVMRAEPGLGH